MSDLRYVQYDPDTIWTEMNMAYIEQGGDLLYPGDEKEMLLRGMMAVIVQTLASVDNALRMATLEDAADEYLDRCGEKRGCTRIAAKTARATVSMIFSVSGRAQTIPAGTALTADGQVLYLTQSDIYQTGYDQAVEMEIAAEEAGTAGNALLAGTQMQLVSRNDAVVSITVITGASGGTDREGDDAYRERIRRYGLSNVTTGAQIPYESAAMAVSSSVLDARAVNLGAGQVGVYLLLDAGADSGSVIQAVTEALNPVNVRPLTDTVTVQAVQAVAYTLNVQATVEAGTATAALHSAISEYQTWQDDTIGRHFNPDRLMAMLYQAGATRVVWANGSQIAGAAVEYTPIASNSRCMGTITLEVMTA